MKLNNLNIAEQGFSLVESLAALVILVTVLGFAAPLFMDQRFSNIKSEIRTGAVAASQQILEQTRVDPNLFNPFINPPIPRSDPPRTISSVTGGHTYEATVHYCENSSFCATNTRHIRVEIKSNGRTVYNVETVYTQLQ